MRLRPTRLSTFAFVLAAALAPAALAAIDPANTLSCPIDAARASQRAGQIAAPSGPAVDTRGCLVSVQALRPGTRLYDLRDRAAFLEFHVPGAQHAREVEIASMPRTDAGDFVAYDAGRFRADALATCARLRSRGLGKARVLDGGIAAWAHAHDRARGMQLNRLDDAELAALVGDPATRAVVLADPLRAALGAVPANRSTQAQRTVVLADEQTPTASIAAKVAAAPATFYWIGNPQRLQALLAAQLALERKREAGPAERSACSAL
jgi:rhodanese-related sulfurtransferase